MLTFVLTKFLIKILPKYGFYGIDLHKEHKQIVPENVGLSVMISLMVSLIILYVITNHVFFIHLILVSLLTATFGFLDRIYKFKPKDKIFGLSLIGITLLPFSDEYFFGIKLSYLYIILIPITFMIVCNFTNMLAGLNGLEVGLATMNSFFLMILSLVVFKNEFLFYLYLSLFISLLTFLYFNFYPARAFPGDVLTLSIGSIYISSLNFFNLELILIPILFLNLVDAFLKFITAGIMHKDEHKPTIIKNGKLYYTSGYLSLIRLILLIKPDTERNIVLKIYLVHAAILILSFLIIFNLYL